MTFCLQTHIDPEAAEKEKVHYKKPKVKFIVHILALYKYTYR